MYRIWKSDEDPLYDDHPFRITGAADWRTKGHYAIVGTTKTVPYSDGVKRMISADIRMRTSRREIGSEPVCSPPLSAAAERSKDDLVPMGGRSGIGVLRHGPDEREIR